MTPRTAEGSASRRPRVGIDLGGTKIAGALVCGSQKLAVRTVPTPVRSDNGVFLAATVAEVVTHVDPDGQAEAVAIAAAGRVARGGRRVSLSANLGLVDSPLADWVSEATGRSVVLVNDVQAALMAEATLGSARGHDDVFMVALGTGVGGAFMADGRPVRGAFGAAGDLGHTVVERGGRRCGCGGRGCLDMYGSGRALVGFAREAGVPVERGEEVAELAQQGDPDALGAFEQVATWVAVGLTNVVVLLDPSTIVVGGGLADCGPILMDPLRNALKDELRRRGYGHVPPLLTGSLRSDAPILGAAQLALRGE